MGTRALHKEDAFPLLPPMRYDDGMPERRISLQDRDIALLRSMLESRVMTVEHAAVLHFSGRRESAKKRLQKLRAAGLVLERPRSPFEPAVLHLAHKGLSALRDRGFLDGYHPATLSPRAGVSDASLRHELDILDIRAAISRAVQGTDCLSLADFVTWPPLIQFRIGETLVKPDGLIRILEKGDIVGEHRFFLEADRSTEAQEVLAAKAACYLDYYRCGGFAARHGLPTSANRKLPFRVLFIFKTAERLENFADRLLKGETPVRTQAWLATIREVRDNPLGKIWSRPIDHDRLPSAAQIPKHTLISGAKKAQRGEGCA